VLDLQGIHLLIVEDEWMLAADLARYFATMGAIILGPAATIEQASKLTEVAQAAILDVNINGRRVFPIADELARRGVPFVFFSGDSDMAIPERLRYASSLRKTSSSQAVFAALFPPATALPRGDAGSSPDEVISLLPGLRLAARLLLNDVHASDRLVERTLEWAIRDIEQKPSGQSTEDWLAGLLRMLAKSGGAKLLH
jgi:hypothetical protein